MWSQAAEAPELASYHAEFHWTLAKNILDSLVFFSYHFVGLMRCRRGDPWSPARGMDSREGVDVRRRQGAWAARRRPWEGQEPMKITALEEYGLRCLVVMAGKPDGDAVTVAEIADGEGLTVPYVGKLMATLRQAGFVDSVRGRGGGYVLARPAAEISVEEILNALGEPLFTTEYCSSHPGALAVCAHNGDCSIRSVWQILGAIIQQVLQVGRAHV